jgi:RNA polymerase sigma factor (sigma-70 family)
MATIATRQDLLLMQLIQQGSTNAYEQLYNKHFSSLRSRACLLLKDSMEAEDIVQSVFIDLWLKKFLFDIHTSVHGYLNKAVYHRSLNLLRQKKRIKTNLLDYSLYGYMPDTEFNIPSDRAQRLPAILFSLPVKRLAVFRLVHIEKKQYKQVASELGISVNTVKTQLRIATRVVQEKLAMKKN